MYFITASDDKKTKDSNYRDIRNRVGPRRNWDNRSYGRKERLPSTTKSGRIIKGRGVFVSIL